MVSNFNQLHQISLDKVNRIAFSLMLLVALLYTIPFSPRTGLIDTAETGGGNLFRQLFFVSIFGISLLMPVLLTKRLILIKVPTLFIVTFGWALITLMWSGVPGIGFRRLLLTFICSYCIYYFIHAIGVKEATLYLVKLTIALAIATFLSGALLDVARHGFSDPERATIGAWRGVFFHKNHAGVVIAVALIGSSLKYLIEKSRIYLLWAVVCFFTLWLTKSKSSFAYALLSILLTYVTIYSFKAERVTRSITSLSAGVALCIFILTFLNFYADIFDDPDAFTGRVFIWKTVLNLFYERPLLGHGFGSIYGVGTISPLSQYVSVGTWIERVPHGHNGYIDMLASVGMIGFILLMITFIFIPIKNLLTGSVGSFKFERYYYIAILIFLVFHNTMESSLFDRIRHGWIFFSLVYAASYCIFKVQTTKK